MSALNITDSFLQILMKFTLYAKKTDKELDTKFSLIEMMNSLSRLKQDKKFINRDLFTDAISRQLEDNFAKLIAETTEISNE